MAVHVSFRNPLTAEPFWTLRLMLYSVEFIMYVGADCSKILTMSIVNYPSVIKVIISVKNNVYISMYTSQLQVHNKWTSAVDGLTFTDTYCILTRSSCCCVKYPFFLIYYGLQ